MMRGVWMLARAGRFFYAVAMLAFGALHIGYGDFVTRVVPYWPAAIPGRSLWAYAVGVLLLAGGAALFVERRAVHAAVMLGAGHLLSFVCLGVPLAAAGSLLGGRWTVAGKALALAGGAFLVAHALVMDTASRVPGSLGTESPWSERLARLASLGTWFFAAFLVMCGIQHFIFVEFVTTLVPAWMPGGGLFWTYAAGILLIVGGVGLLLPMTSVQAGVLSGVMIFFWVFMVHIPRAAGTFPRTTGEMTAVFEALAMSGIAWLAAALAVRRHVASGAERLSAEPALSR